MVTTLDRQSAVIEALRVVGAHDPIGFFYSETRNGARCVVWLADPDFDRLDYVPDRRADGRAHVVISAGDVPVEIVREGRA